MINYADGLQAVDFRMGTVLTGLITMILGIVMAFVFGWKMALLTVAMLPIIATGSYLSLKIRSGSQRRDAELMEEAGKVK